MVRACARRIIDGESRLAALSNQELAISSGIALYRIDEISSQLNWDGVDMDEVERFLTACHFDPTNPHDIKRIRQYLRSCQTNPNRQPFHHLRQSPWWESQFKPLIRLIASRESMESGPRSPQSEESSLMKNWRTTHA